MAKVFELRIVGDTSDIEDKLKQLGFAIKEVKQGTEDIGDAAEKASNRYSGSIKKSNIFVEKLNDLTGGAVNLFLDMGDAAKKAGISIRTSLLATGIGALVVALGAVVAYWDEIVDFVKQTNENLEKQLSLTQQRQETLASESEVLEKQIELNELQGVANEELQKQQIQLLELRREQELKEIDILEAQLNRLKAQTTELTLWDKVKVAAAQYLGLWGEVGNVAVDRVNAQAEEIAALEAKLNSARESALDLSIQLFKINNPEKRDLRTVGETDAKTEEKQAQKRIAFLQMVEDAENEYFDRKLSKEELEKRAVNDKYFFLIEQAKLYGENTLILEEAQRAALKEISDKYDAEEEEARKKKEEQDKRLKEEERKREEDLANYKIQTAGNVLNALNSIAEKGSAGAKAIAIAQAVLSTYQGINKALAETTDFTPTQTLRFANAAAVGIAGFANVSKILSTDSSGSSSFSGATATGGSSPAPPSFNLVRGTGENQLLEGITRQQDPIEAYVVSDRVTSSAALNRNRASEASLG